MTKRILQFFVVLSTTTCLCAAETGGAVTTNVPESGHHDEACKDHCPYCGQSEDGGDPETDVLSGHNRSIWKEDYLGVAWAKGRPSWSERGVDFTVEYVADILSNRGGSISRFVGASALFDMGLDIDTQKLDWWNGGLFHLSSIFTHGSDLSIKLREFNRVSSIEADDSFSLYEAWYQHTFAVGTNKDRFLSIRGGQLAVDQEFATCDTGSNFLNTSFGQPRSLDFFDAYPRYPKAGAGIRFLVEPAMDPLPGFYVQTGLFEGNPFGTPDSTGFDYDFRYGVMAAVEIGYKLDQRHGWKGLPGSYKVGAYFHTDAKRYPRIVDPAGNRRDDNHIVYLMGEQMVWQEDREQGLSVFASLVSAPSAKNIVHFQGTGGVAYTGPIPGRDLDKTGLACTYADTGDGWDRFFIGGLSYEVAIETFYQVHVTSWWIVQPDVQYITNPGFRKYRDDAIVAGIRTIFFF